MSDIAVDKVYDVSHERKGNFRMKVSAIRDEWIDGEIVDGMALAIMRSNERFVGDLITVRASLCSFKEVPT